MRRQPFDSMKPIFLLAAAAIGRTGAFSSPPMPRSVSNLHAHKIMVIGTGFLGSEIVSQLDDLGIEGVSVSKSSGDFQVDLTEPGAEQSIKDLAKGCEAVICTVGSIGTPNDELINKSGGIAARAAKQAGVKRFVFIGNPPKVRKISKNLPALQGYARGKESTEAIIRQEFGNDYTIVQPTFMYGGDKLSMSPPRLPSTTGSVFEAVLGLYPIQALSDALPGVLGVAVEAPVSRERVARAAINAALGHAGTELSSRDDIILAASKRPNPRGTEESNVQTLVDRLLAMGDCGDDPEQLKAAFVLLEEIEALNKRRPAYDESLNGRWDFVFDIEPDLGTGVVKDILKGDSPIKGVFNLKELYMIIKDKQSEIDIIVTPEVFGRSIELVLKTKLVVDETEDCGTVFLEQFSGIELMGRTIPIPESWRRSRPLEISYLDDNMFIARGNGSEPHYLRRGVQID